MRGYLFAFLQSLTLHSGAEVDLIFVIKHLLLDFLFDFFFFYEKSFASERLNLIFFSFLLLFSFFKKVFGHLVFFTFNSFISFKKVCSGPVIPSLKTIMRFKRKNGTGGKREGRGGEKNDAAFGIFNKFDLSLGIFSFRRF